MSKRRLAVVLNVPEPLSREIDGLRRALGDSQMRRIGPHITIIPPINVRDDDLDDVITIMRQAAASRTAPLELTVGPVGTFAPTNPVLYLAVEPEAEVRTVFNACLVGKLERPQQRGFVPHITIDINRPDDEHPAAVKLLSGFRAEAIADRLELMELSLVDGRERWSPIADAQFGGEASVDAGSIRVTLSTSTLVDPITAAVLGLEAKAALGRGAGDGVVVTARNREGQAIGLVAGRRRGRRASVFRTVFVVADARGQGVARRLIEAWERAAAGGGAVRAVAPSVSDEEAALLNHLGWVRTERILDRRFS